jgi:hypothetical protein
VYKLTFGWSLDFDHVPIEIEFSRLSQCNSKNFRVLDNKVRRDDWIVVDLSLDHFFALVELVEVFFLEVNFK